jgi:hypothetical protein
MLNFSEAGQKSHAGGGDKHNINFHQPMTKSLTEINHGEQCDMIFTR